MPLGLAAKLYLNSGTFAAAATALTGLTLTPVNTVKNLSLSIEKGEADVSTRDNDGWGQFVGTLKRGTVDIEMVYTPGNAAQESLRDAFTGNTQIGAAIMSNGSATANSEGLVGNFDVMKWERTEDLEGAQMINCTIKPYSKNSWVEVA